MKKIKKLLLCGAVCTISLCCSVPIFASKTDKLLSAARKGNFNDARYYVYEGANGESALVFAVKNKNANILRLLLEDNINKTLINSILESAIKNKQLNIIEFFLNNGFDINARVSYDETLLMRASENGTTDIVRFLINKGADINIKNNDQETALKNDRKNDYKEIIKLIEDVQPKKKSFFGKLFSKNSSKSSTVELNTVKTTPPSQPNTTVTKKINSPENTKNDLPSTPKAPVVPSNLTSGKNIKAEKEKNNVTYDDGATEYLFDSIKYDCFLDVLKALKNNANVNARNRHNQTPLMLAVKEEQLEVVKLLIQNHADVNATFISHGVEKTILMMTENERIRDELIRAGAHN